MEDEEENSISSSVIIDSAALAASQHGRKTSNHSMINSQHLEIACENLVFKVPSSSSSASHSCWPCRNKAAVEESSKEKTIINGVSAVFKAARFTAVMGASGAGKTSLLSLLAGDLRRNGSVKGEVRVNGDSFPVTSRRMRDISGFVFQEDVLLDTMTVEEAIAMSAALRLPDHVSKAERQQRIRDLIDILGLQKCASTRIGDSTKKGVSGGERKRTSIAMELVTNPPVLFLDEPTSGLDTSTAYAVCRMLMELAHDQGRTVIATIHQPSSEIYHLFDDLLLMADGKVLYYGEASEAVGYFASRGLCCPQYTNPADFFFMQIAGRRTTTQTLLERWPQSSEHAQMLEHLHRPIMLKGVPTTALQQRASFGRQFGYLLRRAGRNAWRNRMIIQAKLGQNTLVGLLVGLIYYNTGEKSVAVQIQVLSAILTAQS